MAARGDVLALRRAIGFLPGERIDRFAVLQSDRLAGVLDTVVVIPLDDRRPEYSTLPGVVPVTGAEAGTEREQAALVTQLTNLGLDRFEASPVGRLRPATLRRIGQVLKLVLELS